MGAPGKLNRAMVTVGMGLVLVVGACRTDREVTRPEPRPITEESLAEALISQDDLPDGSPLALVDGPGAPVSDEVLPEVSCDDALTELTPTEAVSSDLTGGGLEMTHAVAWFRGRGGAIEDLFRQIAEDCAQVVATDQGLSIRSGPLDFGVLSDDALALQFEIEPATGPIAERDVILVRQGDLISLIRLDGPRPSDKVLLDTVVRTAIGRLGRLALDTT